MRFPDKDVCSGMIYDSVLGSDSRFLGNVSGIFSYKVYFIELCVRVFEEGLVALFV